MADIDVTQASQADLLAEITRLEKYLEHPGSSRDTPSRTAAAHADIREIDAALIERFGYDRQQEGK